MSSSASPLSGSSGITTVMRCSSQERWLLVDPCHQRKRTLQWSELLSISLDLTPHAGDNGLVKESNRLLWHQYDKAMHLAWQRSFHLMMAGCLIFLSDQVPSDIWMSSKGLRSPSYNIHHVANTCDLQVGPHQCSAPECNISDELYQLQLCSIYNSQESMLACSGLGVWYLNCGQKQGIFVCPTNRQ